MLLEFLTKLFKLQAFLFKDKRSISTQKSNQKVSANKSKNHTLAFATANALGSIYIVFLRCFAFFNSKILLTETATVYFPFKHHKKSNKAARVSNFGSG